MKKHESNLKTPFVMYISAPRGSGKTFLLINLMIHNQLYKKEFEKVYLFCPSAQLDPKYDLLNLPNDQIFEEYTPEKLQEIVDNNGDLKTCIILDDCIAETGFKSNKNNDILNTLAIRGRHLGISLIICTQKTTGASTIIRSQCDGLFVFKPRSLTETKAIYGDNCINNLSFNEFKDLLNDTTKEQYSFMYINYQKNKVYNKNFEEIAMDSALDVAEDALL